MSHQTKSQSTKGWALVFSTLLITACAGQTPPLSGTEETSASTTESSLESQSLEQSLITDTSAEEIQRPSVQPLENAATPEGQPTAIADTEQSLTLIAEETTTIDNTPGIAEETTTIDNTPGIAEETTTIDNTPGIAEETTTIDNTPGIAEETTAVDNTPDIAEETTAIDNTPGIAEKTTTIGNTPGIAEKTTTIGNTPGIAEETTTIGNTPGIAEETTAIDNTPGIAEETTTIGSSGQNLSIPAQASTDALIDSYVVLEGDTLWDISIKFLREPWRWPEIWYQNPQVINPHQIYPGDVLTLVYVEGKQRIQVSTRGTAITPPAPTIAKDTEVLRPNDTPVITPEIDPRNLTPIGTTDSGMQIVKMSPRIRAESIQSSIPSIPFKSIRSLLERAVIVDEKELNSAAHVISSIDSHLINSTNDTLYVRNLDISPNSDRYQVFRPSRSLKDPVTDELLGYEALYVGETRLLSSGNPATLQVISSVREILRNDRVLPINTSQLERDFFPKPPAVDVRGVIVSAPDTISLLGQDHTIAINLGTRDGVKTGDLLNIRRQGKMMTESAPQDEKTLADDETDGSSFSIKLPDEEIGTAMIIRAYEKMSYMLVLTALKPVRQEDYVQSP